MRKGQTNNLLSQRFRKCFFCVALVALLFVTSTRPDQSRVGPAQSRSADNTIELHQALLDLTNPWTVMCVAAHPDDEDGATLTVLRRKYGVHTVTLFSTFGEGGQNAIGPELYEDLGVIRSNETIKAAAIQGSEPYFLGMRDFGFSKSAEETFRSWGHDKALRYMVLQIRTLRPDVIITNHDTTSGHGHHQATGRLVEEAFEAAADPSRFSSQLLRLGVWQAQRLFVRVNYERDAQSRKLEDESLLSGKIVTINPNEREPIRGSTYADQALRALQQHASQGPWPQTIGKTGAPTISYRLVRQSKEVGQLPPDSSTFWNGLKLSGRLAEFFKPLTIDGRPPTDFVNEPEKVFRAIIDARDARTANTPSDSSYTPSAKELQFWLRSDQEEKYALAAAKGIVIAISPQTTSATPKSTIKFLLTVTNQGAMPFNVASIHYRGLGDNEGSTPNLQLAPGKTASFERQVRIPPSANAYVPGFVSPFMGPDTRLNDRMFGMTFSAYVVIDVSGTRLYPPQAISRIDVKPSVDMGDITPYPVVLTPSSRERNQILKLHFKNNENEEFEGQLAIESEGRPGRVSFPVKLRALGSIDVLVETKHIPGVQPEPSRLAKERLTTRLTLYQDKAREPVAVRRIQVAFSDARVASNLQVGYIRGTDDSLRNAINALGVQSRELTIADIRKGDLKKFDTIIIDNRGFQVHPELIAANSRLMTYTRAGGTLIVFYHKANEWNADPAKNRGSLAPFPITLGNERVTDENAPISFIDAQHPLLNFPNKIHAEDFAGWIQERGLYYPKSWDPRYQTMFAMSDKGEEPLRGGLLVADYGRGHYIYTSMVWYRQLRAGVPGAYRMFANMISYGTVRTVKE